MYESKHSEFCCQIFINLFGRTCELENGKVFVFERSNSFEGFFRVIIYYLFYTVTGTLFMAVKCSNAPTVPSTSSKHLANTIVCRRADRRIQ